MTEPTERELQFKARAQSTKFPDLYYELGHTGEVPPIEEWEKALVGKKLLRGEKEEAEEGGDENVGAVMKSCHF